MKIKILFLLLLTNLCLNAQNISGTVINKQTKEPISHLIVQVTDSDKYQITNENGEFSFNYSDISQKTLIFENTYYVTKKIQILNSDNLTIELEPNTITLEEIIIVNQPYSQVLNDIFNAKSNAIDKQVKLETYYIEKILEKDQLVKTADGLVDFYIIDKKKDFVNSKIIESRLRYLTEKTETDSQNISLEAKPSSIVETAIQLSGLKKIVKNKNYDYHTTSFNVGDKQMYSLYFYPKENAKDDILINGKIIYDSQTKKIEEIIYNLVPEQSKYSQKFKSVMLIAKFKVNNFKIHAKYASLNGFNVVTYANYHINSDIKFLGREFKYNNELIMYTHKIDILETKKYPDDYFTNQSLFKFGNLNHSNFWEKDPYKNWELKL